MRKIKGRGTGREIAPPTVISKSRDMARLCCCVARSLTTESCSRPSRGGRLAHQRLKSRTSICRLRAWPVAAVQPRVRLSSVADRRASAPARPVRLGSVVARIGPIICQRRPAITTPQRPVDDSASFCSAAAAADHV